MTPVLHLLLLLLSEKGKSVGLLDLGPWLARRRAHNQPSSVPANAPAAAPPGGLGGECWPARRASLRLFPARPSRLAPAALYAPARSRLHRKLQPARRSLRAGGEERPATQARRCRSLRED